MLEPPRTISAKFHSLFIVFILAGLYPAQFAAAAEEPLWEYGLGVGAIAYEDYRGSKITHGYPFPLPYVLYNGDFLKADRDGIRGSFLNLDWLELNVSGNGTAPVRRDPARFGMPDLKSTFELGPSLDFHLLHSADRKIKLDLDIPARAAFALGGTERTIGWTFTPQFRLDVGDPLGLVGWNIGVLTGPLFATRRYDAYFYTVAAQFATLSRGAYAASGGYGGTQTIISLSKRFPNFWVGGYLRHDVLNGASFAASPLVETDHYWAGGLGIAWMIGKSTQIVTEPE